MNLEVRLGYCFTPYQQLWLYNGAPLFAFYDTLGIRRTYSRLQSPASSRGILKEKSLTYGTISVVNQGWAFLGMCILYLCLQETLRRHSLLRSLTYKINTFVCIRRIGQPKIGS